MIASRSEFVARAGLYGEEAFSSMWAHESSVLKVYDFFPVQLAVYSLTIEGEKVAIAMTKGLGAFPLLDPSSMCYYAVEYAIAMPISHDFSVSVGVLSYISAKLLDAGECFSSGSIVEWRDPMDRLGLPELYTSFYVGSLILTEKDRVLHFSDAFSIEILEIIPLTSTEVEAWKAFNGSFSDFFRKTGRKLAVK